MASNGVGGIAAGMFADQISQVLGVGIRNNKAQLVVYSG
jgi:hypothetical protein